MLSKHSGHSTITVLSRRVTTEQLPYLPPPVSAGPEEGCSFKAWHRARHTGDPQDMVIVGKSSVERFKVSLKGVVSNCVPGTSAGSDFYR